MRLSRHSKEAVDVSLDAAERAALQRAVRSLPAGDERRRLEFVLRHSESVQARVVGGEGLQAELESRR